MIDREKRIESIYQTALDLAPSDRAAFLAGECAGDREMREFIEHLLAHHEAAPEDFLLGERELQERSIPDLADGFRVKSLIGEGGMGAVYLAEQTSPIKRDVALKVIKHGMATHEMLGRFDSERRSLALMSHPSIAQVFDAGTTKDGRPYFVMEYVSGESITEYCKNRRLGTKERIRLFMQVCEAIHHAHQKGVIHRDIKPNNVIVSQHEDRAIPKVIDFGISKVISPDGVVNDGITRHGEFVGTPEYMSPEHAAQKDVDTRTDIYSLGMLLYQLLAGVLPFDPDSFRERGLEEMIRMIRVEDPPKPSERIASTAGDVKRASLAEGRDFRSIARELRGDLDWITMRALEKDRDRRYGSALDLAADLKRCLDNEAVLARPPSSTYRMRKFVRRNQLGVGLALVSVIALLTIAVNTSIQSRRVQKESERVAEEAALSREVSDYLARMIHNASLKRDMNNQVLLGDALDVGASALIDDQDDADVSTTARIRLLRILGDAKATLFDNDGAQRLLEQSQELANTTLGPDHIETAESSYRLTQVLMVEDRHGEFREPLINALRVFNRELGASHPKTLSCERALVITLNYSGRYQDAVKHIERLRSEYKTLYGDEHPRYGMLLADFAGPVFHSGAYNEGINCSLQGMAILDGVYGAGNLMTQVPIIGLAQMYRLNGNLEASQITTTRWRTQNQNARGQVSSRLAQIEDCEAWIQLERMNTDKAIKGFATAINTWRQTDSTYVASSYLGMALALIDAGQPHRALLYARLGFRSELLVFGDNHTRPAVAKGILAEAEFEGGRVEAADSLMESAMAKIIADYPSDYPHTLRARVVQSRVMTALGRFEEAQRELDAVRDTIMTRYGPQSRDAYRFDAAMRELALAREDRARR